MKKSIIRFIAMMLLLSFSSVFFACGGNDGDDPTPPPVCEHDYQVKEDRPHTNPEEYGTVVMECTKCEVSYEQKYFGHSIKGCDLEPLFNQKPTNIEECAYCKDISNHTCPCGEVCDVNVFYRYTSGGRIAIFGAYFYRNANGGQEGYFPTTGTSAAALGPKMTVATIFDGKIVSEVDASGMGPTGYYRHIFYFPGLVEKIGESVLSKHNVMKGVWLPKTVKEIGSNAFYSNERMDTIRYEGTILEFDLINKGSGWLGGEKESAYPGHYNNGEGCRLYASDGELLLN